MMAKSPRSLCSGAVGEDQETPAEPQIHMETLGGHATPGLHSLATAHC